MTHDRELERLLAAHRGGSPHADVGVEGQRTPNAPEPEQQQGRSAEDQNRAKDHLNSEHPSSLNLRSRPIGRTSA